MPLLPLWMARGTFTAQTSTHGTGTSERETFQVYLPDVSVLRAYHQRSSCSPLWLSSTYLWLAWLIIFLFFIFLGILSLFGLFHCYLNLHMNTVKRNNLTTMCIKYVPALLWKLYMKIFNTLSILHLVLFYLQLKSYCFVLYHYLYCIVLYCIEFNLILLYCMVWYGMG